MVSRPQSRWAHPEVPTLGGTWARSASRAWRRVRTALSFAMLGIASLVLSVFVMPALRLLPGGREAREIRAQRTLHWSVRAYLRALRLLRILRIECTGGERLREPGTLVVANHPTLIDVLVLMSLMPQADCVVKERYFQNPVVGGVARAAGYIPSRDAAAVVATGVERLLRGRSLIIFPEGTRSPLNGLGPFHRGAAHIAVRAGCDPVPVTIRCDPPTLHHQQRWWDVPERCFQLTLRVGEPLRLKELCTEPIPRARAARLLTASLRGTFERSLALVES